MSDREKVVQPRLLCFANDTAELVLHRERVARHCNGIIAVLDTLRQEFADVTKQHDEEAMQFRATIEKMEKSFAGANKSSK